MSKLTIDYTISYKDMKLNGLKYKNTDKVKAAIQSEQKLIIEINNKNVELIEKIITIECCKIKGNGDYSLNMSDFIKAECPFYAKVYGANFKYIDSDDEEYISNLLKCVEKIREMNLQEKEKIQREKNVKKIKISYVSLNFNEAKELKISNIDNKDLFDKLIALGDCTKDQETNDYELDMTTFLKKNYPYFVKEYGSNIDLEDGKLLNKLSEIKNLNCELKNTEIEKKSSQNKMRFSRLKGKRVKNVSRR